VDRELSFETDRLSKKIDKLALEIDGLRQKLAILESSFTKKEVQRWD